MNGSFPISNKWNYNLSEDGIAKAKLSEITITLQTKRDSDDGGLPCALKIMALIDFSIQTYVYEYLKCNGRVL